MTLKSKPANSDAAPWRLRTAMMLQMAHILGDAL